MASVVVAFWAAHTCSAVAIDEERHRVCEPFPSGALSEGPG
jgi:hypothetical protein